MLPTNGRGTHRHQRRQARPGGVVAEQQPVDRIGDVDQAEDGERDRVQLHRGDRQLDQAVPDAPPGGAVPQPPVQAAEHAGARLEFRRRLDLVAETPPEQPAVQRAEPSGQPQRHGEQQQADHGADDRRRDREARHQQHHGDAEAGHPGQPAEEAVEQLMTSPAGQRGTEDDARYPPELFFHRSIVLCFTRRGGPAPRCPRPGPPPRTRTACRTPDRATGCATAP